MIACSNAEAGHASNEHAMPTQIIDIFATEKQVMLEREFQLS